METLLGLELAQRLRDVGADLGVTRRGAGTLECGVAEGRRLQLADRLGQTAV
jgi:hypothetical protein